MSGSVLIMTLFGGTGTLLGPFVGAGVFIWMRDFLSKHLEYWEVFVGGAFVLIVLFLPDGIVGTPDAGSSGGAGLRRSAAPRSTSRRRSPSGWSARGPGRGRTTGALLESRGLTKTFGGLTAVNRRRLPGAGGRAALGHRPERRGQDHASSTSSPASCRRRVGASCSRARTSRGLPAHAVSRLGIARSYQVTNIFGDLTVFENVRIAAQSRVTHYRFWGNADRLAAVNERAEEILRHLGLARQAARAGARALARRAALPRDRHRARHRPRLPAARRADGGHEPGRDAAHGRLRAPARRPRHHRGGGARHGGGDGHLRSHHRAQLRRGPGRGHAGRDPRERRTCAAST